MKYLEEPNSETESRIVGVRGQGRREVGTWSLMGTDYQFCMIKQFWRAFPGGPVAKNPPANARDMSSVPGPGQSHMHQSK